MTTESIRRRGWQGNELTVTSLYSHDPGARANFLRRFWDRVEVGGEDECWPWTGRRDKLGYGRIGATLRPGAYVNLYAHRLALVLATGSLRHGLCTLHSCDNPPCCNPRHLRRGDQYDNVADRNARGRTFRGYSPRVTAALVKMGKSQRKLTPEQVTQGRKDVAEGRISIRGFAREMGIRYEAARRAVKGYTYKEVGE